MKTWRFKFPEHFQSHDLDGSPINVARQIHKRLRNTSGRCELDRVTNGVHEIVVTFPDENALDALAFELACNGFPQEQEDS